jgi:hypothetical protein
MDLHMKTIFAFGLVIVATFNAGTAKAEQGTNGVTLSGVKSPVTEKYEPVSFETLSAYQVKVDWQMNPTNSNYDTVKRDGDIPAAVKLLSGKNISVQGYIKPLKQDSNGCVEFLLMRNHGLCCQTNVPKVNEWIHVRMTRGNVTYNHEQLFSVRGVLQVGELLGGGNVISIYQLTADEIAVQSGATSGH